MAKKKGKRYTDEKRAEILGFIEAQGRGGQTKAIKKYKVTAATIASWKKKAGSGGVGNGRKAGGSKELGVVQELGLLLAEIATTEDKLASLRKQYQKLKAKL